MPQDTFTRVGPLSLAATSNRPSVTLPRRRQLSKERCATIPTVGERHAQLGLVYAYMQRKEDAVREAHRAVEIEPESQHAFHGAVTAGNLALVYALMGEQDQAITLIERLLSTPGSIQWLDHPQNITLAELASAVGMGFAAKQPAFPENSRRDGAEDRHLEIALEKDR